MLSFKKSFFLRSHLRSMRPERVKAVRTACLAGAPGRGRRGPAGQAASQDPLWL